MVREQIRPHRFALFVLDVGRERARGLARLLDAVPVVALHNGHEDGQPAALLLHAVREVGQHRVARDVRGQDAPRLAVDERDGVPILGVHLLGCG